ncbi:MAG: (d)CMP kinase [Polyangiaceae bacterium]|nr:(d)CMP kinase [Polyangiaceae bacterium]
MTTNKKRSHPVVAIDGPAGAGKSTVTRMVAEALGYTQVDTGALYRSVAYLASQAGLELSQASEVGQLALRLAEPGRLVLSTSPGSTITQVSFDGEDISEAIRRQEVGLGASVVSQHPQVREALLAIQRQLGVDGGVVLEGRDIGSVVFPDAEAKFFLTASIDVRAQRRLDELKSKGQEAVLEDIRREVAERDRRDMERPIAPLMQADDAIVVDSSAMSIQEVTQQIVDAVEEIAEGLEGKK